MVVRTATAAVDVGDELERQRFLFFTVGINGSHFIILAAAAAAAAAAGPRHHVDKNLSCNDLRL